MQSEIARADYGRLNPMVAPLAPLFISRLPFDHPPRAARKLVPGRRSLIGEENEKRFGSVCAANPTISIVNAAEEILGK
jgi:hypothetical protein